MHKMLVLMHENMKYFRNIEYVLEAFCRNYGIRYKTMHIDECRNDVITDVPIICYSKNVPDGLPQNIVWIKPSLLFSQEYKTRESLPRTPLLKYENLPLIYSADYQAEEQVKIIYKGENCSVESSFDVIASIFYLLTQYEELFQVGLDEHGRHTAAKSLAFRENYIEVPLVNAYFRLIKNWIDLTNRNTTIEEDNRPRTCITIDIDRVRLYRKYSLRELCWLAWRDEDIKKKDLLMRFVSSAYKDPFDTFDLLEKYGRKYGLAYTYYLMAGGESKFDYRYDYGCRQIETVKSRFDRKCAEIGLHGSYDSYRSWEMLKKQKDKLTAYFGMKRVGIRQHFLRWDNPKTWESQARAGFSYDTSLMYPDMCGFRAGICGPFQPFDLEKNEKLDIWEIPPIVMDGTLFNYQKLSREVGLERVKSLIDTVKSYNGVFTLIWHNSSFSKVYSPGWRKTFEDILKYLKSSDFEFTTPMKLIEDL